MRGNANSAFPLRYFSSVGDSLKDILARELNEEMEDGRAEMPEELSALKSTIEKDWKIVDDGATTRMHRTVGSSKVVISFHCQDTVEDEEFEVEVGEEGEEAAVPFRFEILVSKAGNTMVIGCVSNAGESTIDGVSMTNDDIETVLANGIGRLKYQGPEFPELAEDLQEAFQEYIESDICVNQDVSAFVSMYADYKEQSQYVQFLKDATKVIS